MGTRNQGLLICMPEHETEVLRGVSKRAAAVYTSLAAGRQAGHWLRVGNSCSELIAVAGERSEIAVLPIGMETVAERVAAGLHPAEVTAGVASELAEAVRLECHSWRGRTRAQGVIYLHGPGSTWRTLADELRQALGFVITSPPTGKLPAPDDDVDDVFASHLAVVAYAIRQEPLIWPAVVLKRYSRRELRTTVTGALVLCGVLALVLVGSWLRGNSIESQAAALDEEAASFEARYDPSVDDKLNRADRTEVAIKALTALDPVQWGRAHPLVVEVERRFCDRSEIPIPVGEGVESPVLPDGCPVGSVPQTDNWDETRCQSVDVQLHYDVALPTGSEVPEGAVTPADLVEVARALAAELYGSEAGPPVVSAEPGWQLSSDTDGDWIAKVFTLEPSPNAVAQVCDPLVVLQYGWGVRAGLDLLCRSRAARASTTTTWIPQASAVAVVPTSTTSIMDSSARRQAQPTATAHNAPNFTSPNPRPDGDTRCATSNGPTIATMQATTVSRCPPDPAATPIVTLTQPSASAGNTSMSGNRLLVMSMATSGADTSNTIETIARSPALRGPTATTTP